LKIELTDYQLSETPPIHLPSGVFQEVYKDNPRIRTILYKLPDDAYLTAKREFMLYGFCTSFSEFNYFVNGYCQAIVEIFPSNKDELFLEYPTNHEHIDGLKRELESYKNKVKELTKIIRKLDKK
jgi:hypothetical protein